MAHRKPLRRHPGPLRKAERQDRIGARRGLVTPGDIIPEWWARSSRNGGRDQIGTVGEIIPEWWATSSGTSKYALGSHVFQSVSLPQSSLRISRARRRTQI